MIIGHTYTTHSIGELEELVKKEFLPYLTATDTDATVFGLTGDLGTGKTAFVKAVAKQLGITEQIVSPTFIIAKFYTLPNENTPLEILESAKEERNHPHFHELVHIDAYRLEDPRESSVLLLDQLLTDGKKLIFIEWPEMLGDLAPKNIRMIRFTFIDEKTRTLSLIN